MRLSFLCTAILFAVVQTAVCGAQTIRVEAESATLTGPNVKVSSAGAITAPSGPVPTGSAPSGRVPSPTGNAPAAGSAVPLHFSGTGYLTGFLDKTDQATVRFNVPSAGLYRLSVAYRCQGQKGYDLAVNGVHIAGVFARSALPGFSVQDAGKVELVAGDNEIVVDRGWGFFDLDYFDLQPLGKPTAPVTPMALPVDAAETPAARALLLNLDRSFGKTTMLGVYSDDDAAYVQATTGKLPAIMGGDLIDYSPQRAIHRQKPNMETERLIADSKRGYVITLSWHWASPSGQRNTEAEPWWKSFYTEATTYDLSAVLADPNGKEYALMLSDIDTIAVQLRKLQDAGIPVLWRPLHEAAGGWFWWGAKGPKAFVQLWQILFDRLTRVDGIHNLVWVYTGDDDALWYPGDEYVDIIGIDAYPKDLRDPESSLWDGMQRRHAGSKPVTISEFGGVPDVPRMERMGEFWSYAVSWSGREGPKKNIPEELKRIYDSPGVTTMAVPATVLSPSLATPAVSGQANP